MKKLLLLLFTLSSVLCSAQTRWVNPEAEGAVLHGQSLLDGVRSNYYHRLPDAVEESVTDAVWKLSRNAAGQTLKFYTNSSKIIVRYTVAEVHAMRHMPATGKSGLDMYSTDKNGVRRWCGTNINFADTITANYSYLYSGGSDIRQTFEYELELPPYNTVTSLKIGIDEKASFNFSKPTGELPIIVYGTSITQGACASRPSMIWASIVRRELDAPLINLGFSGNGLMAEGILDVIKATPAKLVILDCMPNMYRYAKPKIVELTLNAIKEIRESQPNVPIILTDHLGYPHSEMMRAMANKAEASNEAILEAYNKAIEMGCKNLYHLTYDDIAMPNDGTVEGIHPSDLGMRAYADAYIELIRDVLSMNEGELVTQKAVPQQRDSYNWEERHSQIIASAKAKSPKVVILGNSIMHQWGGSSHPNYPSMQGGDSWTTMTEGESVVNMGAGWDKVENLLWRVQHGALDGYCAEKVVVAIGVNNLNTGASGEDIAEGIRTLIEAIKSRQPKAEIKVCGIFPMRAKEEQIADVNKLIKAVAKDEGVSFGDPGKRLLTKSKKVDMSLYKGDGLHLNVKGYERISDSMID